MSEELDRNGIPVNARPTGKRRIWDGQMHGELRRGEHTFWPFCWPHEDCVLCKVPCDHDHCPTEHNHISESLCPESCDACAVIVWWHREKKRMPAPSSGDPEPDMRERAKMFFVRLGSLVHVPTETHGYIIDQLAALLADVRAEERAACVAYVQARADRIEAAAIAIGEGEVSDRPWVRGCGASAYNVEMHDARLLADVARGLRSAKASNKGGQRT